MHELSIVQGLVSNIEHQKKKYNFDKVLAIHIMCGKYNCLSEGTIQFCYDLVTENSYMHGARITLLRLSKDYVCMQCRHEFNVAEGEARCPLCDAHELMNRNDNGIYIHKMEVE